MQGLFVAAVLGLCSGALLPESAQVSVSAGDVDAGANALFTDMHVYNDQKCVGKDKNHSANDPCRCVEGPPKTCTFIIWTDNTVSCFDSAGATCNYGN